MSNEFRAIVAITSPLHFQGEPGNEAN